MLLPTPKTIRMDNGADAVAFAEFNGGFSHIIVDDGCWVVVNGEGTSAWIFPEAMSVLRQLPDSPNDYGPYRDWVKANVPVPA